MQYKPKNIAALQVALGGLPDAMHVKADRDVGVSAKTVGELRKVTAWPDNLVIATPQERGPESAIRYSARFRRRRQGCGRHCSTPRTRPPPGPCCPSASG